MSCKNSLGHNPISMFITLTSQQYDSIFNELKSCFRDFPLFDAYVADKLKRALLESSTIDINETTTKKVINRYYNTAAFTKEERKALLFPLQMIFQSAYVLVISHHEMFRQTGTSIADLLKDYPQFKEKMLDDTELKYLVNFRSILKVALTIIPAVQNKGRLVQIAGRLEGSGKEYITGSGQKAEVTRREDIYHKEGGVPEAEKKAKVPKIKAPKTAEEMEADADKKKRKKGDGPLVCSSSSFCAKKMRLAAATVAPDLQRLLRLEDAVAEEHLSLSSLQLTDSQHQEPTPAPQQWHLGPTVSVPHAKETSAPLFSLVDLPFGPDRGHDHWLSGGSLTREIALASCLEEPAMDSCSVSCGLQSDTFSCWGDYQAGGRFSAFPPASSAGAAFDLDPSAVFRQFGGVDSVLQGCLPPAAKTERQISSLSFGSDFEYDDCFVAVAGEGNDE